MKRLLSILITLFTYSCTNFTQMMEEDEYIVHNMDQDSLVLAFSHNINGETHPCGCRHFPLGGLPQIAGQMELLKKKGNFLYVDTGDTFFPSSNVPHTLEKSLKFTARNLAKALDDLGLKYFVPGDQDFAFGWEFLNEIANDRSYHFLLTNLKNEKKIKHKKYAIIQKGPHKIFLLGVLDKRVLPSIYQRDFDSTIPALKAQIEILKTKEGLKPGNPFHRLIILSHSGYSYDKTIANSIDEADWIIGAHSQSFLRTPLKFNNAQVGQILSRNHYLGEVRIALNADKKKDKYFIHEIRDELKANLHPNPWIAFIDNHKKQLDTIRDNEQNGFTINTSDIKYKTTNSCLDCHSAQTEFYDKTAHSLAYTTLLKANEANNLTCVKCHSLGQDDKKGFFKAKNIISIGAENKTTDHELAKENYWSEVKEAMKPFSSVRSLASDKRVTYVKKWREIDKKHDVYNNFANVQCLNCHTRHSEHPFEPDNHAYEAKNERLLSMQNKCLTCHDPDQSPDWYMKNAQGLANKDKLNQKVINKKIKAVACPSISN